MKNSSSDTNELSIFFWRRSYQHMSKNIPIVMKNESMCLAVIRYLINVLFDKFRSTHASLTPTIRTLENRRILIFYYDFISFLPALFLFFVFNQCESFFSYLSFLIGVFHRRFRSICRLTMFHLSFDANEMVRYSIFHIFPPMMNWNKWQRRKILVVISLLHPRSQWLKFI